MDVETHLGFDLADRKHMPIVAPNSGKVIYADRLGIYGNCLVVDHGYGLQTIYGHMSHFDVKVGDRVEKGQKMGLSGETGLAGGDHLHFSMQVDGVAGESHRVVGRALDQGPRFSAKCNRIAAILAACLSSRNTPTAPSAGWNWHTTDQNAAKQFYSSLFGWEAIDYPMGPDGVYTIFRLKGRIARPPAR